MTPPPLRALRTREAMAREIERLRIIEQAARAYVAARDAWMSADPAGWLETLDGTLRALRAVLEEQEPD